MKSVLFGFVLLLQLSPVCYGRVHYESIFWEPDLFSHEVNTTLYMTPNSEIKIICPSLKLVVRKRFKDRQYYATFENLWISHNKTSYDNCRIDKKYEPNAGLYRCDNPGIVDHMSLTFPKRLNKIIPEGGKDYYLISTSDGSETSIERSEGGNCLTHNMRIRVHFCKLPGDPDPNCRGPFDPKSNICPATGPCHGTTDVPEATPVPVPVPVPATVSETYDYIDADAEVFSETVIVRTSGGYDYSLPRPIELVWSIGHNQTQTKHISEADNHPLVVLCEAPNSKVSLLNEKGTIVDSWLCQHAGERLVILKPEYRNGDVYLFEALPDNASPRQWKSTLTVNIGSVASVRQGLISKANSINNLPGFALLVSMYLMAASAL